jgi:hypothetical protein
MKPLLLIPLLCLCGCVASSVPKTVLSGSLGGQPFALQTPKDSELKNLMIEVRGSDTWGGSNYTAISIESLKANMNPAVITTTAEGQVQMIQAVGAEIRATAASAAK